MRRLALLPSPRQDTESPESPTTPAGAPQGYFGLETIAARMGVSKTTILAWHRRYLFPLYSRRIGPRTVWYTHEGLIERWEVERCVAEHKRRYGQANGAGLPATAASGVDESEHRPTVSHAELLEHDSAVVVVESPPPPLIEPPRAPARELLDVLHSLSQHLTRLGTVGSNGHRDHS